MDICLVPVWRLPRRSVLSSSRSMHFDDVSETNGHVTQNASVLRLRDKALWTLKNPGVLTIYTNHQVADPGKGAGGPDAPLIFRPN